MKDFKKHYLEFCNKINNVSLNEEDDDDLRLLDSDEFWDCVDNMIDELYDK